MTEPRPQASPGPALVAFSERLHRALGDSHQIASPLGAWMLLAIAATATRGAERQACASVLGMDVDEAAALSARLLRAPHPAVACGAALWTRLQFETPALRSWRSRQPASVVPGEMPSQEEANDWARRATAGLIDRFPGDIQPLTALVLATALATKSRWTEPYDVIEGEHLARPDRRGKQRGAGDRSWANRVRYALRSTDAACDKIVRSPLAGDLAVHRVRTRSGLSVTSVIARAGVPAGDVLAAALQIGTHPAGDGGFDVVSLFDLPVGHDELWSIEERRSTTPGRHQVFRSYLPAWEARSEHDLLALPLELGTATKAIAAMLDGSPMPPQARQMALARYTRTGFEAAAISFTMVLGSAMREEARDRGLLRLATLRFGHPFAVVAVVGEPTDLLLLGGADAPDASWQGLPVFSAWVAEPSEAELSDEERQWEVGDEGANGFSGGRVKSTASLSLAAWWRRLRAFLRR